MPEKEPEYNHSIEELTLANRLLVQENKNLAKHLGEQIEEKLQWQGAYYGMKWLFESLNQAKK